MRTIKGYLDEWRIQEYLLITFFISWLSWGILILLTTLKVVPFTSVLGTILFTIGGFGPTISAIMCIEGKLSFKKLKDFIFSHRKRTIVYLLLFAILEAVVIGLSSTETNSNIMWYYLPIMFIVCAFFGGGNEELGWRGTLQPLIERVFVKKIKNQALSYTVATLCVGLIWALWHLPLWFVGGSTQQGINFGLFTVSAVCLSFWLACLYRCTHSVFYCMLLHGLSNVLLGFFAIKVNWLLCLGFAVITAISIVLGSKSKPVVKISEG